MTPNELYAIPGKKPLADLYEAELALCMDQPGNASRRNQCIRCQQVAGPNLQLADSDYELQTWGYNDEPFLIQVYCGNDDTGGAVDVFCTNRRVLRAAQVYLASLAAPDPELIPDQPRPVALDKSLIELTSIPSGKLFEFVKSKKAKHA